MQKEAGARAAIFYDPSNLVMCWRTTLETSGHLLDGDLGPTLDLRTELRAVGR